MHHANIIYSPTPPPFPLCYPYFTRVSALHIFQNNVNTTVECITLTEAIGAMTAVPCKERFLIQNACAVDRRTLVFLLVYFQNKSTNRDLRYHFGC